MLKTPIFAIATFFRLTNTFTITILTKTVKMSTDYKFEGWVGLDKDAAKGNMQWQSYEPKAFQESDIDVRLP